MSELLLHGPGAGSGPIFDMECTEHSEISKSLIEVCEVCTRFTKICTYTVATIRQITYKLYCLGSLANTNQAARSKNPEGYVVLLDIGAGFFCIQNWRCGNGRLS